MLVHRSPRPPHGLPRPERRGQDNSDACGVRAHRAGRAGRLAGRPIGPAERPRFGYMPEEQGCTRACGARGAGLPRRAVRSSRQRRWETRRPLARAPRDRRSRTGPRRRAAHGTSSGCSSSRPWSTSPTCSCSTSRSPVSTPSPWALMADLLAEVAAAAASVLFSSHQLDLVEHLCEDVVIIDEGRVVLDGELAVCAPPCLTASSMSTTTGRAGLDVAARRAGSRRRRARLRVDQASDAAEVLAVAQSLPTSFVHLSAADALGLFRRRWRREPRWAGLAGRPCGSCGSVVVQGLRAGFRHHPARRRRLVVVPSLLEAAPDTKDIGSRAIPSSCLARLPTKATRSTRLSACTATATWPSREGRAPGSRQCARGRRETAGVAGGRRRAPRGRHRRHPGGRGAGTSGGRRDRPDELFALVAPVRSRTSSSAWSPTAAPTRPPPRS